MLFDYDISPKTEDETAQLASVYLNQNNLALLFIHFDHVDHAGHEYGHGTAEYYVEKADVLLGQVMDAISFSATLNETLVIISADHGGLGKAMVVNL
jgi:predicted AlkP superfamily pyrophosphatase or phosphodiesterase